MKKIAVLMSTYNGEKYIEEQIDSILNQNCEYFFHLFIRDDGSTDKTLEIIDRYVKMKKVTLIQGENLRTAKSFMELMYSVKNYDYYSFADQDDCWNLDKLQRAVKKLEGQSGPCVYFSNAEIVDSKLNNLGRNVYKNKPSTDFETFICSAGALGCTIMYNAEMANIIQGNRKPEIIVLHDSFICRVCLSIGGTLLFDNVPTMKYRQHSNNVLGVSVNKSSVIKQRLKDITTKAKIGIDLQAEEIISIYSAQIPENNLSWLKKIAGYNSSLLNRIRLACSHKTKYESINMAIKFRLSILFGNR